MLWASERQRQLRVAIAFRCIQLGLDEKKTFGEVSSSEVGVSEVGADQIGQSQVSLSEVGSFEFGPDQVGASQILLLVSDFGSHEFAHAQQQDIDVSLVCPYIQFQKSSRALVRQTFGLRKHEAEFLVERMG